MASAEPFYREYKKLLQEGKALPEGVEISIGSMGSVFFSDTLRVLPTATSHVMEGSNES